MAILIMHVVWKASPRCTDARINLQQSCGTGLCGWNVHSWSTDGVLTVTGERYVS